MGRGGEGGGGDLPLVAQRRLTRLTRLTRTSLVSTKPARSSSVPSHHHHTTTSLPQHTTSCPQVTLLSFAPAPQHTTPCPQVTLLSFVPAAAPSSPQPPSSTSPARSPLRFDPSLLRLARWDPNGGESGPHWDPNAAKAGRSVTRTQGGRTAVPFPPKSPDPNVRVQRNRHPASKACATCAATAALCCYNPLARGARDPLARGARDLLPRPPVSAWARRECTR